MNELKFQKELEELINRHSMENWNDTPDYILSEYLMNCFRAFSAASIKRDAHYNSKTSCQPPQRCINYNSFVS